jgi:hypothetical protein
LKMALGYQAVARKQWDGAAAQFAAVVRDHPDSEAAPEAQYWEGVARYSGTHDASHLRETARRFTQKYASTGWAKCSPVWGGRSALRARLPSSLFERSAASGRRSANNSAPSSDTPWGTPTQPTRLRSRGRVDAAQGYEGEAGRAA